MTEPLLEGIEDNPVYRYWGRPAARPRANEFDSLFVAFLAACLALALLFPIVALAGLASLLIARLLMATFREPTADSTVAGRTLREWADLEATGCTPRDVALGLWGLRARGWRLYRPSARAYFWAAYGMLFTVPVVGRLPGERIGGVYPDHTIIGHLAAPAPWVALGAAVTAYFLARAFGNPWGALPRARAAFHLIAPAYSEEEGRAAAKSLRDTFAPAELKRRPSVRVDNFAPIGCFGPIFVSTLVAMVLERNFFGSPELRRLALLSIVGGIFGLLLGRYDARADRLASVEQFLHLVTEVRGTMKTACLAVHGPHAATSGVSMDVAFGRAREHPREAPRESPGETG